MASTVRPVIWELSDRSTRPFLEKEGSRSGTGTLPWRRRVYCELKTSHKGVPRMPERERSENSPERSRKRFPGISSRAYEHPADRTALVALRKIDGFDILLRKLSGFIDERKIRLSLLADGVKVGDTQFVRLQAMLQDAVDVLDLGFMPEMYVVQNPQPNAFTIGMDRPTIVLTTGLYELMDEEEMRFVVGHEVGHVLSGHAVYRTMLFW